MNIIKKQNYPKINEEIKAAEVRVISEKGENFGVMPFKEALAMAKNQNLDLVEIAPNTVPPVVKIINFDKWRYQKEKEDKKNIKNQKQKDVKHVQISPRIAQNDLIIKARQVDNFLTAGHKVEIILTLRGRENVNKDWALKKMEEFINMIKTPYQTTMQVQKGGRGYTMQITKK